MNPKIKEIINITLQIQLIFNFQPLINNYVLFQSDHAIILKLRTGLIECRIYG